jgi:hypothetical protein
MAASADPEPAVLPASTSALHVQLYQRGVGSAVRWRVLSANNRDMGRCVLDYADEADCVRGIADFLASLDELTTSLQRAADNRWTFRLLRGDVPVVTSGRGFDRRTRCEQAAARFIELISDAEVRPGVALLSPSRRAQSSMRADPVRTPNVAPRWAPVHTESAGGSSRPGGLTAGPDSQRRATVPTSVPTTVHTTVRRAGQ